MGKYAIWIASASLVVNVVVLALLLSLSSTVAAVSADVSSVQGQMRASGLDLTSSAKKTIRDLLYEIAR